MKLKKYTATHALAAALIITAAATTQSEAAVTININEVAGKVTYNVTGSIDLSATLSAGLPSIGNSPGLNPNSGAFISVSAATIDLYNINLASWQSFGTGSYTTWDAGSGGTQFALFGDPLLGLPEAYISNAPITGSGEKVGATFISLGINAGTYVNTITNGANTDTITIIATAAVPEPSSTLLLGLSGIGFLVRRKR